MAMSVVVQVIQRGDLPSGGWYGFDVCVFCDRLDP